MRVEIREGLLKLQGSPALDGLDSVLATLLGGLDRFIESLLEDGDSLVHPLLLSASVNADQTVGVAEVVTERLVFGPGDPGGLFENPTPKEITGENADAKRRQDAKPGAKEADRRVRENSRGGQQA